jgi:hypothetical protein
MGATLNVALQQSVAKSLRAIAAPKRAGIRARQLRAIAAPARALVRLRG